MKSLRSIPVFALVVLAATMVIASPVLALSQSATSCETGCGDACAMPADCCEKLSETAPAHSDADHEGCCTACHLCHSVHVAMHPPMLTQGLVLDLPSGFVTDLLAWRSAEPGVDLFRPPCL